jgi:toxin FitB
MHLLDTDIISNFRKRKPHPNLLGWFSTVSPEDIAISVISIFEIEAGLSQLASFDPAKAAEIEAWLANFVLAGTFNILPVGVDVARLYGRMFVTAALKNFVLPDRSSKRPKSGADLILAATSIVHGATVVTANTEDFLRIHRKFPLPSIYHPFSGEWPLASDDELPTT